MKSSFAAKTLLISFISVGLALVLITNASLYYQGLNIQQQVEKQVTNKAKKELHQALENSFRQNRLELDQLTKWDDIHQQLHQPSYYYYWHQQRLKQSGYFKPYYHQLELYSSQGNKLVAINHVRPNALPDQITEANHYIFAPFINQEYYVSHQAIYSRTHPEEIIGYVALAVNFHQLLAQQNQFFYLDFQNLYLNRSGIIGFEEIIEALVYRPVSNPVSDQLWELIEQFVMIFTLISLTAALIVFGFIQAFFLRPLTKVGEYLQHLRLNPNQQISDTSAPILLKECQELKGQLGEYHNALLASQNQLKKSNQQLEHLSLSDPTTNIGNQRALDQYWQTSLEMQSLSPKPVAYLMLSCENFRGMVYQYGFQITEELVKQWVARLKEHNSSTPLFRISPDTLVMTLVDVDPQTLEQQAHTIIEQLGTTYSDIGIQQPVLFRLGISYVDRKKDSLAMKRLPKQADFALYRAMHSETSRVYIFSEPL